MIVPGMCYSLKGELWMAIHTPGDNYRIALYRAEASLSPATRAYTTEGEVEAYGYEPGGASLRGFQCGVDGTAGVMGWSEPVLWRDSDITAYGALIYNASKGNRAMGVQLFTKPMKSIGGLFRLLPPPCQAETALFRIL